MFAHPIGSVEKLLDHIEKKEFQIIKNCVTPENVDIPPLDDEIDPRNSTILQVLCQFNVPEHLSLIVWLLDECDANVNLVDECGQTAIEWAAACGFLNAVKVLFAHGASLRMGTDACVVHAALEAREVECAKFFIDNVKESSIGNLLTTILNEPPRNWHLFNDDRNLHLGNVNVLDIDNKAYDYYLQPFLAAMCFVVGRRKCRRLAICILGLWKQKTSHMFFPNNKDEIRSVAKAMWATRDFWAEEGCP